jgi:hypothetical protein
MTSVLTLVLCVPPPSLVVNKEYQGCMCVWTIVCYRLTVWLQKTMLLSWYALSAIPWPRSVMMHLNLTVHILLDVQVNVYWIAVCVDRLLRVATLYHVLAKFLLVLSLELLAFLQSLLLVLTVALPFHFSVILLVALPPQDVSDWRQLFLLGLLHVYSLYHLRLVLDQCWVILIL